MEPAADFVAASACFAGHPHSVREGERMDLKSCGCHGGESPSTMPCVLGRWPAVSGRGSIPACHAQGSSRYRGRGSSATPHDHVPTGYLADTRTQRGPAARFPSPPGTISVSAPLFQCPLCGLHPTGHDPTVIFPPPSPAVHRRVRPAGDPSRSITRWSRGAARQRRHALRVQPTPADDGSGKRRREEPPRR